MALRKNEKPNISLYSLYDPIFPNEPTSNQFLTPVKFEWYHRLGLSAGQHALDLMNNDASFDNFENDDDDYTPKKNNDPKKKKLLFKSNNNYKCYNVCLQALYHSNLLDENSAKSSKFIYKFLELAKSKTIFDIEKDFPYEVAGHMDCITALDSIMEDISLSVGALHCKPNKKHISIDLPTV